MENEELENVDKAVISGTQRVSALSFLDGTDLEYRDCQISSVNKLRCSSFATTAKGLVRRFDAMLRPARGSTTSPARQPAGPSSP